MALFSTWYQRIIVDKVEVPGDLPKSISGNSISHRSVPEARIFRPVVVQGWEMVDHHQKTETEKSLEFFYSYLCPFIILLRAHNISSIFIALLHYLLHYFRGEEHVEDLHG